MKKALALTLAGIMLFTTPVMAADSPSAEAVKKKAESRREEPRPAPWYVPAPWYESASVQAPLVPAAVANAAVLEGKSIGEYMNNAVTSVPGLENVVPIGQGGHVIIDGAPSNQVFSVLKPAQAYVTSAKTHAALLGGRVLNVVRINASVGNFRTAKVNFYTKGIVTGQPVRVFQIINGTWVELDVAEVRTDHIVVEMTSLGTIAFIEVPEE